ncbi:MBL fold metallo-hydrolase [Azoarcus sp. KH32C]|uniref:MBL fold metallo-hydrolase n=1 Tax=Azoarcus sp. KH32C TaxID=748247 RepID=UPI0002385DD1|nr:MBL fold metallo-hydrolase [Azoarcus sp. KH32C]BAL27135.1 hypothetical protein AZKH_p0252 [Azoarcus sp. KH32C]
MRAAALGGLLLAVAVLVSAASAHAAEFIALAPGAFVLPGPSLAAAAPPDADTGNVGLLVGQDAALLVDTGASARQGHETLAAARRATDRPLRLALISHGLPEFLFGANSLQDAGIPVVAHARTAELIAQRCAICLQHFVEAHGADAMAGSWVPRPDPLAPGDRSIDLGGRSVELLDFGWASTPGDVAVLDRANGILFAGGLVIIGRVPLVRDADVTAWIAALDRIAALPIHRVVPGHGPVVAVEAATALRAYLVELDTEVRRRYAAGASLSEAVEGVAMPAYATWAGYPQVHRQNVHYRYLALERAEFDAAARTVRP